MRKLLELIIDKIGLYIWKFETFFLKALTFIVIGIINLIHGPGWWNNKHSMYYIK